MTSAFQARYDGWCAHCHKRIEEGQWIKYDDEGNLVHDDCGDEED